MQGRAFPRKENRTGRKKLGSGWEVGRWEMGCRGSGLAPPSHLHDGLCLPFPHQTAPLLCRARSPAHPNTAGLAVPSIAGSRR